MGETQRKQLQKQACVGEGLERTAFLWLCVLQEMLFPASPHQPVTASGPTSLEAVGSVVHLPPLSFALHRVLQVERGARKHHLPLNH